MSASEELLSLIEQVRVTHQQSSASLLSDLDYLIEETQRAQRLLCDGSEKEGGEAEGEEREREKREAAVRALEGLRVKATEVGGAAGRKSVSGSLSKLTRAVDRSFAADVEGASFLVEDLANEKKFSEKKFGEQKEPLFVEMEHMLPLIAQHYTFYGNLNVAEALRSPQEMEAFRLMERIHKEILSKDLYEAFEWCVTHKEELARFGSDLHFLVAKRRFLQMLFDIDRDPLSSPSLPPLSSSSLSPLDFARSHFECYLHTPHFPSVLQMMTCLAFSPSPSNTPSLPPPPPSLNSLYPSLFLCNFGEIAQKFREAYLHVCSFPASSPLCECVEVGAVAMPTLVKFGAVLKGKKGTWDEIPAEINLGRQWIFHSIFSCPVSREQTSQKNPPMLLICGHVIAR